MAMIQCFMIAKPNWSQFLEAVSKASKRAEKLGMAPLTWELAPELDGLMAGAPVPQVAVALMGDVPETLDWRIVGRLEYLPDSQETLIHGDVPDRLRHEGMTCDHCHTPRARQLTYVLRFGNGSAYKRVGRACLSDFLQTDAADKLAKYFDLLASVTETLEVLKHYDNSGCGREYRYYAPEAVLLQAAATIRAYGWVSRAEAERMGTAATGDHVRRQLEGDESISVTSEDETTVDAVLTWLNSNAVKDEAKDSPYLHNLYAMAASGSVPAYKVAHMASAAHAYKRSLEKKEAPTSSFVGTTGKREDFVVTLIRASELPPTQWGSRTCYSFVDGSGNKLVWFSSSYSGMQVGRTYHVAATVEKHDIYRESFQTVISRVTCQDFKLLNLAAKGDLKGLKKLLDKGYDVNIRDSDYRCPLHQGVLNNQPAVVQVLLDANAILDAQDRFGYKPLTIAIETENASIAELLLNAGALPDPELSPQVAASPGLQRLLPRWDGVAVTH